MRLLIIEDDEKLSRLIQGVLENEHYVVDTAHDGNIGLELALTGVHSVIVMDWMLPGRDGLSICRAIRNARLVVPILMLTARERVCDRIAGLDTGADDYLVKPFIFDELLARIRALSRRLNLHITSGDPLELRCGNIILDVRSYTARYFNHGLSLTATEWQVLECLVRHAGQALSREQIFSQVWAHDSLAHLTMVDVYISYLRRKLKTSDTVDSPIETVRGVGYRLSTSPSLRANSYV
jgi:two-component system, OmpR family, response regulator